MTKVEQLYLIKSAGKWQKIRAWASGLTKQKPVFGQELADRANKHGVAIGVNAGGGATTRINKVLSKLGINTRTFDTNWNYPDSNSPLPKILTGNRFKGVVLDPVAGGARRFKLNPQAKVVGRSPRGAVFKSKLDEARQLPGILPDTVSLRKLINEHGIDMDSPHAARRLQGALRKQFGDKYILKPNIASATAGSSLPTEATSGKDLLKTLREGVRSTGYNQATFGRGVGGWIAQPRIDLQRASYMDRVINGLATMGKYPKTRSMANLKNSMKGKYVPGADSLTGNNMHEYRVHVLDGKVVPYATMFRGGARGFLPWQTKGIRQAEAHATEAMKKLPSKYKGSSFGLDVAKDKGGKFHIIETNPSDYTGTSGLLQTPQMLDAMESAVRGKLPRHVMAQRGIEGVGGAGAVGAGGLAVANTGLPTMGPSTREQQWATLLEKAGPGRYG